MTRTEADLIASLETRVRAKDDIIVSQYVLLEQLRLMNEYLLRAVELLSLPRVTNADVQFVIDGLQQLETQKSEEIRH